MMDLFEYRREKARKDAEEEARWQILKTPQKAEWDNIQQEWFCSTCGERVELNEETCQVCGQVLDWKESD